MRFEKFYRIAPTTEGEPASYLATGSGNVFGFFGGTSITLLGPATKIPIPSEAEELSIEEWQEMKMPIGLDFGETPPTPAPKPERALTDDELRLDEEYERSRRDWLAGGLRNAAELLATRRDTPLYAYTTTDTHIEKREYTFPLIVDALAAVSAMGPGPVDPIGWRRGSPTGTHWSNYLGPLVETLGSLVNTWAAQKAQQEATTQVDKDDPKSPPGEAEAKG